MQLPRVKIQFLNGQLGTVGESADGLLALVCGASAVGETFALNKPYTVTSMDDVADLGLTPSNNPTLHKHLGEFYDEAGGGVSLVIYGVSPASTMTALCDYTQEEAGHVRDLITRLNGTLRGVALAGVNTAGGEEVTEGLDPDVYTALPKAQQVAEWATGELFAPLFVVLEGHMHDPSSELRDLNEQKYDRCCIVLGDTRNNSGGAAVGTLLGRVARVSVQRNIGRVKDGSLFPTSMYVGGKEVGEAGSLVASAHRKGYLVPRKYVGRAGCFWADDRLACDPTGDYAHLAPRRVIDKAYRIAYNTLLDMLLDDLELNEDGTLQNAVVKSWEQTVENAVNRSMTAAGELSGEDGEGCVCRIDETQNVLATSAVEVSLKVRPHGYARYVNVKLGFQVSNN